MPKKHITPRRARKPANQKRTDPISPSAFLAAAFPDDEASGDAAVGMWTRGSVLDAAFDLAQELGVTIFHPEVFPAVLQVILREAPPIAAERVTNFRKWLDAHLVGEPRPWMVRDHLQRMRRAAKKGGAR